MFELANRTEFIARLKRLGENERVAGLLKLLRHAILVGVLIYLVHRLSQIGFASLVEALPTSGWFYLFFTLRFFALPLCETASYELIWRRPMLPHFPAFIRKRVYNFAVMGYSGEAFLTFWARRQLHLPTERVLVGVKDNNIISALTSNLATIILLAGLALTGHLAAAVDVLPAIASGLFVIAFLIASVLVIGVAIFRRRILSISLGKTAQLLGLHSTRAVITMLLQAAMYSAALPEGPLTAWLIFFAIQIVLTRVPFVPNQDLVFLSIALSLAPLANTQESFLAAMLLAEAGLSQIFNFVLFLATAYLAGPPRHQQQKDSVDQRRNMVNGGRDNGNDG